MVGYLCKQSCDDEVAGKLAELLDLVTIRLEKTSRDAGILKFNEEFVHDFIDELSKVEVQGLVKEKIPDDEIEVIAVFEELLDMVTNISAENTVDTDVSELENNLQDTDAIVKGILKPSRCRQGSQHHVEFEMVPQFFRAYDANKDFTADIKFVEQHPKKVVSYRALYAAKKAADDQQEEQDR